MVPFSVAGAADEPSLPPTAGDVWDVFIDAGTFLADRGLLVTAIGVFMMVLTMAFIFTPVPADRRW